MQDLADLHEIYIEAGQKKTFAIAVDWPGWCRFGRDDRSSIQRLVEVAPRYAMIASYANLEFIVPRDTSSIETVARLEGNATTDFGAPDKHFPKDWDPVGQEELERYVKLLKACWRTVDEAVENAEGKELQKGPRGGGRDLVKIVEHIVGGEESYLSRLGWKLHAVEMESPQDHKVRIRGEVVLGLQAAVEGKIAKEGPRGGKRWSPLFFVRRLAWHAVDHAWEIEDRII